ncbi:UNVERIFIED_CONTAM: hypothetical protein FKN15_033258 [Acipenser sinensis]
MSAPELTLPAPVVAQNVTEPDVSIAEEDHDAISIAASWEEIDKYEGEEVKKEDEEKKYLDVISNKNIKLSERILIPIQHEMSRGGKARGGGAGALKARGGGVTVLKGQRRSGCLPVRARGGAMVQEVAAVPRAKEGGATVPTA